MLREIKKRLKALEQKIWTKLPFWPDDGDSFLQSLGVDKGKYIVKNPDGSIGYYWIEALSDTAAGDWRAEA